MNTFATCLRTAFLAFFSLSLVGGVIATDYYYRHEESRKARRFLASQDIEVSVESGIQYAEKGDVPTLQQLELAGVMLGYANEKGITPLLAAVRAKKMEVVDFLLVKESVIENLNQATIPERDTPMAHTLRARDFEFAERLVSLGATLNSDKYAGQPFLIDAVKNNDEEMVDFLLDHGVDVNYSGTQPFPAVSLASQKDDIDLMTRLVDKGANLDVMGDHRKASPDRDCGSKRLREIGIPAE